LNINTTICLMVDYKQHQYPVNFNMHGDGTLAS
jgi:hypothetical protein